MKSTSAEDHPALPAPLPAYAQYRTSRRSGRVLHVSGQVAAFEGTLVHRGRVGDELTLAQGRLCARQCALNVLALARDQIGDLAGIEALLKITVFVASAPHFVDQHLVADGASTAFVEFLGERGEHSRSAVGVARLPMNSPVEVEATVLVHAA